MISQKQIHEIKNKAIPILKRHGVERAALLAQLRKVRLQLIVI